MSLSPKAQNKRFSRLSMRSHTSSRRSSLVPSEYSSYSFEESSRIFERDVQQSCPSAFSSLGIEKANLRRISGLTLSLAPPPWEQESITSRLASPGLSSVTSSPLSSALATPASMDLAEPASLDSTVLLTPEVLQRRPSGYFGSRDGTPPSSEFEKLGFGNLGLEERLMCSSPSLMP